MKLCKHDIYRVIDHIYDPKYSTNQVLINRELIDPHIKHYILRFVSAGPRAKYGWFYLSHSDIVNSPTQPNGKGVMYAVDLSKREEFTPVKDCEHIL